MKAELILVMCCAPVCASGSEIMWKLNGNSSGTYYENISLSAKPGRAENRIRSSVSSVLQYATPTLSVSVTPLLAANRFTDETRNSIDKDIGLNISKNMSERSSFKLSTSFQEDTTFSSELTTTGFTDRRKKRRSIACTPSYSYIINEISSISASYSTTTVDYEDGVKDALFDYDYRNSSISYNHATETVGTISATYTESVQKVDLLSNHYKTTVFSLGISKKFSETFSYSISAGGRRYNTHIGWANYDSSSDGWVTSLSATKKYLRSTLASSFSRTATPSGGGYMVLQDKFSTNHSYSFSPLLVARTSFAVIKNSRDTENGKLNRYYGNISAGFTYTFEPEWSFAFEYQHRKSRSEAEIETKDNTLSLSIRYSGRSNRIKSVF